MARHGFSHVLAFLAPMALNIVRVVGLALTLACWMWASEGARSEAWNVALIWCAPLFTFPISLVARKALDAAPTSRRADWACVLTHYGVMIALGVGILAAIPQVSARPGLTIPIPRELGLALMMVTSVAALLTVLNLAWRGLGAPFGVKLSSRLATDWMYRWTRSPMVLATFAFFFSVGLYYRSVWFLVWLGVSVIPGWFYFVRIFEERELEIRFGPAYCEYRARTPFLWPRRPGQAPSTAENTGKKSVSGTSRIN